MGKQVVIGVVILVAGLGGGYGIGYMVSQQTIGQMQTQVDELTSAAAAAEEKSSETLKKAGEEIAKAKSELEKTRSNAIRVNTDLRKAKLENQRLQAVLEAAMQTREPDQAIAAVADEPVTTRSVRTQEPARTAAKPVVTTTRQRVAPEPGRPGNASVSTREYTIQDGDSLWKIAANELGNGMRYKEILALNKDLTENSRLDIGMKIKLPAQ